MADKGRLEKLIGMLGSDFDGERASAALLIRQMAAKEKLTILELIKKEFGKVGAPATTFGFTPAPRPRPPAREWREWRDNPILNRLDNIRMSGRCTAWERSFIADVTSKYDDDDQLSPGQRNKAEEIIDRYER